MFNMDWILTMAAWLRILVLIFCFVLVIASAKKFYFAPFIICITIPIAHLILFFSPPYKPETIISLFLSLGCIAFGIRIIINQFKNT